ncbi:MAG: hypothetical protein KDD94_03185 [Calditrichaeota bacterium]|nr:hypothetical protein [Calditrichota bacterium]
MSTNAASYLPFKMTFDKAGKRLEVNFTIHGDELKENIRKVYEFKCDDESQDGCPKLFVGSLDPKTKKIVNGNSGVHVFLIEVISADQAQIVFYHGRSSSEETTLQLMDSSGGTICGCPNNCHICDG